MRLMRKASNVQAKRNYTTGDIAKLLGVSNRTVVKWMESGKLDHYLIPTSKHRRTSRTKLVAFLKANGMPTLEEYETEST
jgi:excisionase family DNA binding protein